MPKVNIYSIDKKEKFQIISELFEVVSNLKTKSETINFFMGLLTPSEIIMVGRRIQIAKLLVKEVGYENIQKRLKVSHATINKVEHWLNENDDKKKLISDKIKKIIKENNKNNIENNLLDKYPHHRFLKNLLK